MEAQPRFKWRGAPDERGRSANPKRKVAGEAIMQTTFKMRVLWCRCTMREVYMAKIGLDVMIDDRVEG